MGEYFYTNMCSHLFEVAKRILLLTRIIWICDILCLLEFLHSLWSYFYAYWNFHIPFEYIYILCGIFYLLTNISSGTSVKTIFRQRAVFARPAFKSQMYTTHIAMIHYINSKAFAQNPYMENVSASFPKDIFVQKFACFWLIYHNNYIKKCNFCSEVRRYG